MKYKFKVAPSRRINGLASFRLGLVAKISFLLVLSIIALLTLDYTIIRGGLFFDKTRVSPAKIRYTAEGESTHDQEAKNKPNLVATKISIRPGDDGFFRVGNEIKVECTVQNNSHKNPGKFHFLIRTPYGKIVSEIVRGLSPENEYKINGVVTPEKSGVLIVACRSDVDNEIDESNEMDNREVETLYVLPQ